VYDHCMTKAIDRVIKFDTDYIETLRKTRVLSRPTAEVLNIVLNCGGFIAGGFARQVAHYTILPDDISKHCDGPEEMLSRYLEMSHGWTPNRRAVTPYWRAESGDIDVFFPDQKSITESLTAAYDLARSAPMVFQIEDSPMCFAKEIVCNDRQRIQLITKYTGTVEEVLSSFDIHNAMCSLTRDHVTIPEEFEYLEKNKMLHLNRTDSKWAFARLLKWQRKHKYIKLSPLTSTWLASRAIELFDQCKDANIPVQFENKLLTRRKVFTWAKAFMDSFNPEDLLKLSVYLGNDGGYNLAFKQLAKTCNLPGA